MNCIHYNLKVIGKVQGVWFRKYTKDKADEMGLNGTVQNQEDGSVYLEVEHTNKQKLNDFIDWLHQGSPMSNVVSVDITGQERCKGFKEFNIVRK